MNPRPKPFHLSPKAQRDLDALTAYIARDNPTAAVRLIDRIGEKCQLLAHYPDMGQLRPDIARNLRHFPLDAYVILYRVTPEALEVVRVLHGSRLQ